MASTNIQGQAQVLYLSHGGGPLPLLNDSGHQAMIAFMNELPKVLRRPEAILVISAHWEESMPTLLGSAHPPMLYDYYGFPPETYQVNYPAPGAPGLALQLARQLHEQGFSAEIDPRRGFDHGTFIPLMLIYPKADIPVIQLSLCKGLDPQAHLQLGKALQELLRENILIIGSGQSFHNLYEFSQRSDAVDPQNEDFQDWLAEICDPAMSESERQQRLIAWKEAPNSRYCHPREEHLLPLHVCQGLAETAPQIIFDDLVMGKRTLAFQW